ncbi:MAG: 50S ribosomal protein L5 [Candidatus Wallbacteria bacterium]|nr:50S ribosomal protein L5 [Candidatus Wallbacteria bacterium]
MTRLMKLYREKVVSEMMKSRSYKNVMQVPKIQKVVLNMGIGEAKTNPKIVDGAMNDLKAIAGQKPQLRKAKKSISNFKLRAGMTVGVKVTLRGDRMYYFLDKLFNIVLPRVRDFRGVSRKSFDGRGSYTFGVKEQIVFPEIDYDKIDQIRGMDVSIVTTAGTDDESLELLERMGMPFTKK